jgi:hypothetical protein
MEYFQNFQIVNYDNTNAVNIMERCAILNSIFKSVYTFYPYQVKNGMRARTVAERYYGDPNLEWLVYFSNEIVDPYHQWPMDENTFNSLSRVEVWLESKRLTRRSSRIESTGTRTTESSHEASVQLSSTGREEVLDSVLRLRTTSRSTTLVRS